MSDTNDTVARITDAFLLLDEVTLVNVRVGIYAEKRLLLNDSMAPAAFKAPAAANVVSRHAMRPGQTIAGEVIICEPGATTRVAPGWPARLGAGGHLLLEKTSGEP